MATSEGRSRPTFNWRAEFWSVPGETRMCVGDLAEGLGPSKSWVWKRLNIAGGIPHGMVDGSAVFVADEVRA